MSAEAFFDSNVVLYLVSRDASKATKAEYLIRRGGVVSVQVLNEVVAAGRRKFNMPWSEVDALLDAVKSTCKVVPLHRQTHEHALALAKRCGYGIYDSAIIASALEGGCTRLYSEDMQDGQRIAGIAIENPFRGV